MFRHERQHHPCCHCSDEQCRDQLKEKFRRLHELHAKHHGQFLRHYRYFRFFRPGAALFGLVILYLLFSWVGFKGVGLFFAALIIAKEAFQFFFLLRLEKRVFRPVESLKRGLDEVADGNYDVKVEYDKPNDLGFLIAAFNEMTARLSAGEKLQAEYEENRKALLANISHDLKTPLTAIRGYVEALLEGGPAQAENRDRYLRTIHHNIIYVNKLIDDLFLFSKLDMAKLEFVFEEVPARAFMGDLMEEYKFDLAERGVGFEYRDELAEDCRLRLDGKRIRQALNNIIGNAVQHGPEKGLAIKARLFRQEGFVGVAVADNGPGIPADKLPFIFDRFYRVAGERPKDANTGLGLAIARELVAAHGGRIAAASAAGEGSRFTVTLPISGEGGGGE
jgi:signal transduction histidine kinase